MAQERARMDWTGRGGMGAHQGAISARVGPIELPGLFSRIILMRECPSGFRER